MEKVFYINNGVDLKDFNCWKSVNILDDEDLRSDKKKIIYLGSIRLVNNVGQLIKAAGETPYVVGHIEEGEKGVTLC